MQNFATIEKSISIHLIRAAILIIYANLISGLGALKHLQKLGLSALKHLRFLTVGVNLCKFYAGVRPRVTSTINHRRYLRSDQSYPQVIQLLSHISNAGERRTKMACRLRSCF